MPSHYVCPGCLHNLNNRPLALPPVRTITTCAHCGFRVGQSVGSIARAWMAFFGLWAFYLVFGPLAVGFLIVSKSVSAYGENLFVGFLLAMVAAGVAAFLGWLVGTVVGLVIGAPWGARRISGMDTLKAIAAAGAPCLDPRLGRSIPKAPATDSRPTGTKRCWHCGYVIENINLSRWSQVQCPQCRANLGTASVFGPPSDD